jgi:hypothetical protein
MGNMMDIDPTNQDLLVVENQKLMGHDWLRVQPIR